MPFETLLGGDWLYVLAQTLDLDASVGDNEDGMLVDWVALESVLGCFVLPLGAVHALVDLGDVEVVVGELELSLAVSAVRPLGKLDGLDVVFLNDALVFE